MSLLLSLSLIFTLAACSGGDNNETSPATDSSKASISIEIKDEGKSVDKKELEVDAKSKLMPVLKENFEIEEQDGFITSIDKLEQDTEASKFWTYTVNSEEVTVGAKDYELKDKDEVVFSLDKYE